MLDEELENKCDENNYGVECSLFSVAEYQPYHDEIGLIKGVSPPSPRSVQIIYPSTSVDCIQCLLLSSCSFVDFAVEL